VLGEPEPGSDAAALSKLRGHWLLPAVGKPAAAAVLADLKVQRIADGEWLTRAQGDSSGIGSSTAGQLATSYSSSACACAAQCLFWLSSADLLLCVCGAPCCRRP
jgi:hypothetical protein